MLEKRSPEAAENVVASKKAKWSKKAHSAGKDKKFQKNNTKEGTKDQKDTKRKGKSDEEKKDLTSKEIKIARQKREDPNFELRCELKKLWEKLRNAENAKAKEEFVEIIYEKIRSNEKASFLDFAYAHDTTRVLQSCLQHGTAAQRRVIYEEVKEKVAEMASSKYARNMVLKLIKYGERDIKDYCIENMGNVRKLVRSSFGQSILEYAYNQFAQSSQRSGIVSSLYGKSYNRLMKTEKDPTLISVMLKNVDFMETILTDFKEDLKSLTEKEVMQQTVSHRAFLDFFNLCLFLLSHEQFEGKKKRVEEIRAELIEELKASVIHMIHTPDGARAGLHCLWFGSAKDRKLILKTLKEFLVKVATSEYGHLLLFGAMDSVDDTVLVKKQIVLPLCKEIDTLIKDKVARKIFWYILNPRDRRAFLPDVIKLLEVGDQTTTSKKPREIKYEEIKSAAVYSILEWFSENMDQVLSDTAYLPLLTASFGQVEESHIRKNDENILETAQKALSKKFNVDYDESHPLAKKGVSMTLKHILKLDKDREEFKCGPLFVSECVTLLPKLLSDNKGCFFLLQLLETGDESVKEIVKESISAEVQSKRSTIKQTKGGELLLSTKLFN